MSHIRYHSGMWRSAALGLFVFVWLVYGWPAAYVAGKILADGRTDMLGYAIVFWGCGMSLGYTHLCYHDGSVNR